MELIGSHLPKILFGLGCLNLVVMGRYNIHADVIVYFLELIFNRVVISCNLIYVYMYTMLQYFLIFHLKLKSGKFIGCFISNIPIIAFSARINFLFYFPGFVDFRMILYNEQKKSYFLFLHGSEFHLFRLFHVDNGQFVC
jgi:hypothetical protein